MESWVLKLIDELPVQYRAVLTLFHVDGMNYAEIGSVTKMPEGTVKTIYSGPEIWLKEKSESLSWRTQRTMKTQDNNPSRSERLIDKALA